MKWTPCSERLPPDETVVLLLIRKWAIRGGESTYDTRVIEGHRTWETPTWEETYTAFPYFTDTDGHYELEHDDVTHWMPRPDDPT